MSFLSKNNSEFLSARITQKGRNSIAKGNFVISYFQIGDSEFDYTNPFTGLTGLGGVQHQSVFSPFDKEGGVKYPYKIDSSDTSTTYGIPIDMSVTDILRNVMGPAGFVSNYEEYDSVACTGTTIQCTTQSIPLSGITGTTSIIVPTGSSFSDCEYITVVFNQFGGTDPNYPVITGQASSLIYQVISVSGNTITVDRNLPNFSGCSGNVQVICNSCENEYPIDAGISPYCSPNDIDPSQQLNSWTMNIVWDKKPTGFDVNGLDENLTGFTSNKHVSTKQFLGYTTTSGQTWVNSTGGTITGVTSYYNSFDEKIIVSPEEQRTIAIIHYSELGDLVNDPERFYKYDDYISTNNVEGDALLEDADENTITDLEYFEVYIPFVQYHRNTGTTVGALFTMDTTDYYMKSSINPTQLLLFRYLLDEQGYKVGKIYVNNKTIVFDDQELIAVLDYKSNRKYTLPAPKISLIPSDTSTGESFFTGSTTGQTIWVTYMFNYTGDTQLNGLPCNYYSKIEVFDGDECLKNPSQLFVKFGEDSFPFMNNTNVCSGASSGFIANQFQILVQVTDTGELPIHDNWTRINYTSHISGHTVGQLIDPLDITNVSMKVTNAMYTSGTLYDIESYLGLVPNESDSLTEPGLPQFGDEQPFPGSIRLVRATDIERMTFMVNLPSSQFTTTQNPTYPSGADKRITEVALLNSNKEVMVIAKTAKPIKRIGTQVFGVRLDF
jgi:hypothetical protein